MKRNYIMLLLLIAPVLALAGQVKLEDAYRSALQKTEFNAILEAQIKQYEARTEKAVSALFPPVSLKAGYSLQQATFAPGYSDAAVLGLNITQPVYQGDQLTTALEESKLQQKSKELQNKALKLALYSSVASGYYAVMTAEKDKKNIETVITQTKEMIIELEKRKVIGKSKYSEVLMTQAQLAVLEADLEGVNRIILTLREDFSFLTGLPRETEFYEGKKTESEMPEADFYLKASLNRPDIFALQADLEMARFETAFQNAFGLPWVSLTGNIYPLRSGASAGINWDAGINITMKLIDSGETGSKVKEAQYKEKEAELNLAKKKRQVETEVRSAIGNIKGLMEQVKILENAAEMNDKNYLEQRKDYEFSLVTNLEVLQAMNSLQNAKRTLDRTKLELLLAGAKLQSVSALVPEENR